MSSLRERRVAATLNIKQYKRLSSHFTESSEEQPRSEDLNLIRNRSSTLTFPTGTTSKQELNVDNQNQTHHHVPNKPPKYIFSEDKVWIFERSMLTQF